MSIFQGWRAYHARIFNHSALSDFQAGNKALPLATRLIDAQTGRQQDRQSDGRGVSCDGEVRRWKAEANLAKVSDMGGHVEIAKPTWKKIILSFFSVLCVSQSLHFSSIREFVILPRRNTALPFPLPFTRKEKTTLKEWTENRLSYSLSQAVVKAPWGRRLLAVLRPIRFALWKGEEDLNNGKKGARHDWWVWQ